MSHVAGREYTGDRGLEWERVAPGNTRYTTGGWQVAIGEDEAGMIERERPTKPRGRGYGADEAEHGRAG